MKVHLTLLWLALCLTALAEAPAEYDDETVNRKQRARTLLEAKDYDKAAVEFLWLWKNNVEPSHDPVRTRLLTDRMGPLTAKSKVAAEGFGEVLAGYRERLHQNQLDGPDTAIWVVLESQLGEAVRVLAWWRQQSEPWNSKLEPSHPWIFELLSKQKLWREAGMVFPQPVRYTNDLLDVYAKMREINDPELITLTDGWTAETFGSLYRALLAADRPEEAAKVREVVLKRNHSEVVKDAFTTEI